METEFRLLLFTPPRPLAESGSGRAVRICRSSGRRNTYIWAAKTRKRRAFNARGEKVQKIVAKLPDVAACVVHDK